MVPPGRLGPRSLLPMYKATPGESWRLNLGKVRDLLRGAISEHTSDGQPTKDDGPGVSEERPGASGGSETPVSATTRALPGETLPEAPSEATGWPGPSNEADASVPENLDSGTLNGLASETPPGCSQEATDGAGSDVSNGSEMDLTDALGAVAQSYLPIDILDQEDPESMFTGYLLDTIALLTRRVQFLEADDRSASDSGSGSENGDRDQAEAPELEPRMHVLHRIFCSRTYHDHDGEVYEEKPVVKKGDKKLHGKRPITNLDRYISQKPDISFIVFEEHSCTAREGRQYRPSYERPSQRLERMRIVSPALQRALQKCARFRQFSDPEEDNEMDAPYDFLYHHRDRLIALAEDANYQKVLSPLLEFLDKNYAQHYSECEKLIESGRITAAHLGKLFWPNQMVLCRKFGEPLDAFVLKDYPKVSFGSVEFQGWEWKYDGTKLQREDRPETMPMISDEEVEIADLKIHPADSARPEDIHFLAERGNKFWGMRERAFVEYTGWNSIRSFNYASHIIVSLEPCYAIANQRCSSSIGSLLMSVHTS